MAEDINDHLFSRSAAVANRFSVLPVHQIPEPHRAPELDSFPNSTGSGSPSFASLVMKAYGRDRGEAVKVLHRHARIAHKRGRYGEAEAMYQKSRAIAEELLSAKDTELASILNNLARLFQDQKRYQEAIPLYQRSLALVEEALGPHHPKVARRLKNLAELYRAQGRTAEAEPLYERVREIEEHLRFHLDGPAGATRDGQPTSERRPRGFSAVRGRVGQQLKIRPLGNKFLSFLRACGGRGR